MLTRTPAAPAEWVAHSQRGSTALLRMMTSLSLRLGRPASRGILFLLTAYFFVFAPTVRRNSRKYLTYVLGRPPRATERFRHLFYFASTVHDRLYLVNERFDLFDISLEGEDLVAAEFRAGKGAFLVGAHCGSFEVIRAIGRRQPGLRIAMAMYEENARELNALLAAINPAAKPEIIPLGHMEAMLTIRDALESGAFVGMLGDRSLRDETGQAVDFLGEQASFPAGPMRAAALMRRPVYFMAGLYRGSNRYHIVFEPLADFSALGAGERDAAVRAAIVAYARLLEKHCRSDPYNWFNFHDVWRSSAESRA